MFRSTYTPIAGIYDGAAWLYSGGAISACRRWSGARARPGERVLVAGCGTGLEAVAAARAGARVTAVDTDPAMLRRARRHLRRAGRAGLDGRVELRIGDVRQHDGDGYDLVVAAFFLNVFAGADLPAVLASLRRRLAPEGRLVIGDFATPRSATAGLPAHRLYHDLPMHLFARLGANDVHRPHDLAAALAAAGGRVQERRGFPVFGVGPAWIEGCVGRWTDG